MKRRVESPHLQKQKSVALLVFICVSISSKTNVVFFITGMLLIVARVLLHPIYYLVTINIGYGRAKRVESNPVATGGIL